MGQTSEMYIEEQERILANLQKQVDEAEWNINYHTEKIAEARLTLGVFLAARDQAQRELDERNG